MDLSRAEKVQKASDEHRARLCVIKSKQGERKPHRNAAKKRQEAARFQRKLSHIVGYKVIDTAAVEREANVVVGKQRLVSGQRRKVSEGSARKLSRRLGLSRGRELTGGDWTYRGGLPGSKR